MRQRSPWRVCGVLLVIGGCRDATAPVEPEANRLKWG